jgi:hypothetical protein
MPTTLPKHGIADYSTRSGRPVTKHLEVEVTPSSHNRPARAGESDAR